MVRTNLSTRPFYNERAVRVGIVVAVVLTAALTAFNAAEILSLNSRNSELVARAEAAEAKAADLRAQAQVTQKSVNVKDVNAVSAAAREANELIDRRAFSWTDLFNRFEETLPAEVRIVSVTPQVDTQGRMLVAVTVISRNGEATEAFQDRLEDTGAFKDVIPRQDEAMEDGTYRSVIQGYYLQSGKPPATVSPPPASDSVEGKENGTPPGPAPAPEVEGKKPPSGADGGVR